MAAPWRFGLKVLHSEIRYASLTTRRQLHVAPLPTPRKCSLLVPPISILQKQERCTSFFVSLTAEKLWKGVTSVSNAGKKRGRGKGVGRIRAKNLNRGQIIGVGHSNMVWPGLNAPIFKGKEVVEMRQLPPDVDREARLLKLRDEMSAFRVLKLSPMERGWSGAKMPGRSIGPPDPVGDDNFEGFDTRVLEFKTVTNMSGTAGRKRRYSAFVVTGNGNGLGGFALSKAPDGRAALKRAKNRAGQHLVYIERFDGSLFHNFYARFGKTKVYVQKKPKGYGIVCHRALRTICQVIGVKDLYVKVEGNTKNILNLTRAFFFGLLHQKTYHDIAEQKKLHIVELKKENDYYPIVLASPTVCRKPEEVQPNEELDLNRSVSEGRVILKKKTSPPFYVGTYGWEKHLRKTLFRRNHENVRIQLLAEHGELRSHLTAVSKDKLPRRKGIGSQW